MCSPGKIYTWAMGCKLACIGELILTMCMKDEVGELRIPDGHWSSFGGGRTATRMRQLTHYIRLVIVVCRGGGVSMAALVTESTLTF